MRARLRRAAGAIRLREQAKQCTPTAGAVRAHLGPPLCTERFGGIMSDRLIAVLLGLRLDRRPPRLLRLPSSGSAPPVNAVPPCTL